jgi:putative thioredoxin
MVNGKPVDGFMGALPEGQLKAFLDKHLPPADAAGEADAVDDVQALLAAGDPQAALNTLLQTLSQNPANDDARFDYAKLLIETGLFDDAQAALEPALAAIPRQIRFEALEQYLHALRFVGHDPRGAWDMAQFDALIEANKRDFDARLGKARVLIAAGDWTAAMDALLEIILRDKAWNGGVARKTFVAILELLTPLRPKASGATPGKSAGGIELAGKVVTEQDPQAQLVASYRRKLSMALN